MVDARDLSGELHRRGIVKLENYFEHDALERAREFLIDLSCEHGLLRDGGWMTSTSRFGLPKPFRAALNGLNRSEDFPDLFPSHIIALCEGIVGKPVSALPPGLQILFTLPQAGPWTIPRDAWHIDLPRQGEEASPGLQLFTFMDTVEPTGGAPLVVAGSHRLQNHTPGMSSANLKKALRQEAFFRSLLDSKGPPLAWGDETRGKAGDIDLEIVELTGNMGDVYLMDLRVLHTPAPNILNRARMMATYRLPKQEIAERFGGAAMAG